MKHTLAIVLDIEPGLEAAVGHMAHQAIVALNEYADSEIRSADRAMGLLSLASGNLPSSEAQSVWNKLRAEAQRIRNARNLVRDALSEIRHAMSVADSQWRRQQTAAEPSD